MMCYVDNMRVAILADIHSNLEALQACCHKARTLGVEKYVCLGDIIGYCADPVATLDMVMSLPGLIAVQGNHDQAVLNGYYPGVNKSIQQAIRWTHEQLAPEHTDFLSHLPYVQTLDDAVFAHASVNQPEKWEYINDTAQVKRCMQAAKAPRIFLGHTHIPKLFYETAYGLVKELDYQEASPIPFYQRRRYVTNTGSVGQPRDGNSAASFVIYDIANAVVTFYRVVYDFNKTARKILAADLAPHFAKRLKRSDWEQ